MYVSTDETPCITTFDVLDNHDVHESDDDVEAEDRSGKWLRGIIP